MAAANYAEALRRVLLHEGGYSNHPSDPGGVTLNGVTQARYNEYRYDKDHPRKPLTLAMEGTAEWRRERAEIYRRYYANPIAFDRLPVGVDYAVFDYAVNSGVGRSSNTLQRILGVTADGEIGPITLAAVVRADPADLVRKLCDERLAYLKGLPIWPTFGRGWSRRVAGVRAAALAMVASTRRARPTPRTILGALSKWLG